MSLGRDRHGHAARPDQRQAGRPPSCASSSAPRSSRSSWTRRTRCRRSPTSAASRRLAPGGLTRERAGFEVRDVHPTHYGRICPIETPEGPNIGLIDSLATYARVNEYGFIETPVPARSRTARSTDEIGLSLGACEEGEATSSPRPTSARRRRRARSSRTCVACREAGRRRRCVTPEQVDLMDVSPNQLVSVAAALIPFLENDDANRALMGSNMQRQAVPLIRAEAPLVGTGMEASVARDSGAAIVASAPGVVDQVDATRIVDARHERDRRRRRASTSTACVKFHALEPEHLHQPASARAAWAIAVRGRRRSSPTARRPSCGELALGRNVLVAFMPWNGYNFEDSILISERIVHGRRVHLDPHRGVRGRRRATPSSGQEEITRDIPNVGEEALKNLDEARHRLHRRRGERRATSWSARSRRRAKAR